MEIKEWVTGNVVVTVGGQPLEMQMTVPADPVKPHRMLPVFQQMSNVLVDRSVSAVESEGKSISCKKGCGACCRQPVPLAEIEAYQIAELVDSLPEPRQSEVRKRFEEAARHFSEIGWYERLSDCAELPKEEQEAVVLEYFREGIACPFLVDESCSIHQDRPVACREYLVTSPAENCSKPSAAGVKLVKLPIKPSKSLLHIGQQRQLRGINFIPMTLALRWAEMNPEDFPEKTGEAWMADFFQHLTKSEIPEAKSPE